MKKNRVFAICIAASIIILLIIFLVYKKNDDRARFLKNGGFTREVLRADLSLSNQYDLKDDYYSIISYHNDRIYLREYTDNYIISINHAGLGEKIYLNSIQKSEDIFGIHYDSTANSMYVECNNSKQVAILPLSSPGEIKKLTFPVTFDKTLPLGKGEFVALLNGANMSNLIQPTHVRFVTGSYTAVKESNFKIKTMVEDGHFLKWQDNFVYVNYYNNEFFVVDSNLNKKYSSRTIDTIRTLPEIEIINKFNRKVVTFTTQPRTANRLAKVSGDYLYINSMIRGDNEDEELLQDYDILDIYDLRNAGKYKGSYYVDKYKKKDLHDFFIKDNKIVLAFSNKLIIYDLSN